MKVLLLFVLVAVASANLGTISDELIELINNKQTTWKARRNFPVGTTEEYLKGLIGALPTPAEYRAKKLRKNINPEVMELPETFDAREQWPDCPTIKEVRNQANCGSCWCMATVSVMSDRTCSQSGGSMNFRYSCENMMECCDKCSVAANGGCGGGWMGYGFDFWVDTGVTSGGQYGSMEGCVPYIFPPSFEVVPIPSCLHQCIPEYDTAYDDDLHFGADGYMIDSDPVEIQKEIMTNGPVAVSFDIYQDFYDYSSGVYQYDYGYYMGGHAVRILGWGVEDGKDYWLVANSWGDTFGENGFFKILRGVNECEIEIDVHGGTPKL